MWLQKKNPKFEEYCQNGEFLLYSFTLFFVNFFKILFIILFKKRLAQPDIVSVDLGDEQMAIDDMKELDTEIVEILKSNGVKYFFPVQRYNLLL